MRYIILLVVVCFILILTPRCVIGAAPLPELTVPEGFGLNAPPQFTGDQSQDLDLMTNAGFKVLRVDLYWEDVEKQKGVYDFVGSGYDALTQGASQRGIRLMYILDYSNSLYESDKSVRTEAGRQAFATFAETAAQRYAGKGIIWEIWNEPDLSMFWSPQPSVTDYVKLVEVTAPRIRAADSSGIVVAPAVSWVRLSWLEDVFNQGLLNWIDAVTVHGYRPDPPEAIITGGSSATHGTYGDVRNLINIYAPLGKKNMPILLSEWGYALDIYTNCWGCILESENQRAEYLVRMLFVDLYQDIPVTIYYNLKGSKWGILDQNGVPRPAYNAAKNLASTLNGYSFIERIDLGNTNDYVLKLNDGLNEAIAFWTTSNEHTVTLPIGEGSGKIIDLYGVETPSSWGSGGLQVSISQSPSYLLISESTTNCGNGNCDPEETCSSCPLDCCPVPQNAFKGDYFDNIDLTNYKLTRTDNVIDFDWGSGSPDSLIGVDTFSVRWEGDWNFPSPGSYTFKAETDDGMRAWIDSNLVLDKWFDQSPTNYTIDQYLSAGTHRIKVEYYENGVNAIARFSWEQNITSPSCGDTNCDSGECDTCPSDCTLAQCCGIEGCNSPVGETCLTCESDCGPCPTSDICNGLALLMHFDNQAEYGETPTHIYDFSGNGNDGSCSGSFCPTWSSSGKFSGAFDFDGSDDYILVTDSSSLDITELTLSAWVYPLGADELGYVIAKHDYSSPGGYSIYWKGDTNEIVFYYGSSSGQWSNAVFTESNTWVHVTITKDSSNAVTFYKNGVNAGSGTATLTTNNHPVTIGKRSGEGGSFFNGKIDDMAIWNKALSASEIQDIYNSGAPITCATSTCSSGADTNSDDVVSMTELMSYIADWKAGSVQMTELMTAIGEWKNGC